MAKRKQPRTANSSPKLPHDAIEEILVRLPVKSLLRFCCVSKSWNLTISSHQFAKTQLLFSKKMETLQQKMLFKDYINGKIRHFSLDSLLNETKVRSGTSLLTFDTDCFSKDITWIGSCNGLVCLALHSLRTNVILWNPCTGKFKELGDFEHDITSYVSCVHGFGYDKSRDDYKVFRFEVSYKTVKPGVIMKVYSLKANCWKRIENCEFRPETIKGSSAFVNGKLYWSLEFERNYEGVDQFYFRDAHIGYIDAETEERGVMKKPDCIKDYNYPTNLVESEGCLYFYYGTLFSGEVWKIEDNGVGKENWTKIVAISCDGGHIRRSLYRDCSRRNFYHRLLHVGKNGEIVLVSGPKIVIFNEKDCSFMYPDIGNLEKLMAGTFVESLISPLI